MFKEAKSQGYQATLIDDRLYIDKVLYTSQTVRNVPFDIANLHERQSDDGMIFLGMFTPLSNFYIAPFSVDDVQYNCNEQHFQAQKAAYVDDIESVSQIMMSKDPKYMKSVGDSVQVNSQQKKAWDSKK